MAEERTFHYHYSASENNEIQAIRSKYLPQTESKLEELRRLDQSVRSAGVTPALCVGILGCLVFGTGMCLAMKVIGDHMIFGVAVGLLGMAVMLLAYPVYRRIFLRKKEKNAPRILELAAELSGETTE